MEFGRKSKLTHHCNWRVRAIQRNEYLAELDRALDSDAEEIARLNLDWFWIKK